MRAGFLAIFNLVDKIFLRDKEVNTSQVTEYHLCLYANL
jgi:hypothetical protein